MTSLMNMAAMAFVLNVERVACDLLPVDSNQEYQNVYTWHATVFRIMPLDQSFETPGTSKCVFGVQ